MNVITSRKNEYIRSLRRLGSDGEYRRRCGQYICDGLKTLKEAISFSAEITSILWKDEADASLDISPATEQYIAPGELFDYVSPMKNSPGPLFTVKIAEGGESAPISNAIILESVQDPGNVGTVIRTANAFRIDAVILTGECADLYNPKTVRSTMGAIFRQRVINMNMAEIPGFIEENGLKLYATALSDKSQDIRTADLKKTAVAVGSEGNGLSDEFLAMCEKMLIIPMNPDSESLNAAVAAAVVMWEMSR